ncbi:hypothetical protein N0V88_000518 [Collariella sp. IMI 366227]|nr:hypothetical protein N0V88_000518 [Collariella sp. IMI 366227]
MQALPNAGEPLMAYGEPSAALPLLALDNDLADFDYAAFLQEQDIGYVADESSGSTISPPHSTTPPESARILNQPLQAIKGLECDYPAAPTIVHQPQHQVPLFSLQDMRFFQHFLMNCYPHHPIGAEELWTHEYDYLMHAILGYAASDLLVNSDPSLLEAAMTHRLKAIKAIKKALSSSSTTTVTITHPPCHLFEEGNALMATCFALTYQSVLLPDGMAEYMTFIRGVVIVAIQMYLYKWWMMLPHDKFQRLVDPTNQAIVLLSTHWIAMEQIMATITEAERKGAVKMPTGKQLEGSVSLGSIGWLSWLNAQVDADHLMYNQWPMWVQAQLEKDRGFFGRTF